jgi:hypothetical protein
VMFQKASFKGRASMSEVTMIGIDLAKRVFELQGERWQRGESMKSIGRVFDCQSSSVFSVISPTGGHRLNSSGERGSTTSARFV